MCQICGSADVNVCGHGLSECNVCGHIWETGLTVKVDYNNTYLNDRYNKYPTTEAMSYLRLGYVQAHCLSGKLLDVGYGNGSFARLAEKAGYDVYGRDVHGVECGVKQASLDEGDWDVVTFFDSLEHIPDLAPIRRLSSEAKIVVISFPKRPSWLLEAPDEWKHYRPGEHLHYFTVETIVRLFDKTVLNVSYLEDVIRGKLFDDHNIITLALG